MASADRTALEAFFRSTGGDNWGKKHNWATDADLSTWKGVTVDEDGNVKKFYLLSNGLQGPIPEALGVLTNLTELDLGGNELTGPIPDALGALTKLTELKLCHNQLTGPIPEALGALTNLTMLLLNNNQLTGTIPKAVGALTSLRMLFLGSNQLTGTVPLSLWKLPFTGTVDLSENLLTHFTDPGEKTASTCVVIDCMKRLERPRADDESSLWNEGLFTSGNSWEFPPAAVVANGRESVRKYYDTWEQCGFRLVEIHALKVVFVGAYGAGKTSLARSIKMGRGDRTPELDENRRTTVGVDILPHSLRDGTECKIYDVAGQITYYGLHQFFLTERAVYVIVCDATKFEGLSGKELDEAIEDSILEWVNLLHMRTPLCTVMLVGSHFDMLRGATHQDNDQLLATVEARFLELHEEWKSLRDGQHSSMDERMTILPGVFPVGCKLESESTSCTAGDGLHRVDEALSKQTSVVSRVPPSWVAARQVLEQVGSVQGGSSGGTSAVGGRRRPWELRSVIHTAFQSFVEEGRRSASQGGGHQHPASLLSRLHEHGIRDSMDGAIELRAFSGTVISHGVFVVLDVMWLAGVLKPIVDHRGITKSKKGKPVFADRVLGTSRLLRWATELVGSGILRTGFARFLWGMKEQVTEGADDPHQMEPAKFEEILERIGVTIPLPVDNNADSSAPVAGDMMSPEDRVEDCSRRDGMDLLVIMRLPLEADAETRRNLLLARQAAFPDSSGGNSGLKAVFEFDHAGAPHGLAERVMALSHKIGVFSSRARWRLGGVFLLHNIVGGASSMILEYNKKTKTFGIEALGQSTLHLRAMQFVISALYHVARDFSGASWTAWLGCGMCHDGEKMYLLASPNEKQSQKPGSEIVPLTRNSRLSCGSKQRNLCGMQGLDPRGSCTLDPNVFGKVLGAKQLGKVLGVKQPFEISDKAEAPFGGLEGRGTNSVPSTTSRTLIQMAGEMTELTKNMVAVKGGIGRVEGAIGRVEGGMDRVEEGVGRVEEGIQNMDKYMQTMARGIQESLMRLKNLQAPNYRYPYLVEVKGFQAEGKNSLRSRLRGMLVTDVTLHFLCSFDMTKVQCGFGGNGYRLRKTRGWVKKISPALQMTVVTARVALKAVTGVEVPALSGFLQTVQEGFVEELIDRKLNEDVLFRVLSGDEDAGADMRKHARASYEAITEFMTKEEAERRRKASTGDGYVDFRDSMEEVDDGKGGLVWVRAENVQKWRESLPTAAPST